MGTTVLASAQTRILPLGDSITEADVGHASYRYWLWHELMNGGFDVEFVGSMTGVRGGAPLNTDFDQDHEGHWGWRADQVLVNIREWALQARPDIVLMHLGHNDLWSSQDIDSTIEELEDIIVELRSVNADIAVLIAQVIPATGSSFQSIPELNLRIAALATAVNTLQSPVVSVDHFTGFDPVSDTYDGTHPNELGEKKMSSRWFATLVRIPGRLTRSSLPPPRVPGRRLVPDDRE